MLHICIFDLGDRTNVKHKREDEDKDLDREVHPVHFLQTLEVIARVFEEDVTAQPGADDGTYSIETLRQVDSQFRVLGGTAD